MSEPHLQPPAVAGEGPEQRSSQDATAPSFVGRTFGRWRQVLWEIAGSARLPFASGPESDLLDEQVTELRAQMHECLEARGGEVLARAQAANIAGTYLALGPRGKARFFDLLATEFGIERSRLDEALAVYRTADAEPARLDAERALRRVLVTPAMRLLTKFNALPVGLRFLIGMRADLLRDARGDFKLAALDRDFQDVLAPWFDIGFLTRQRLTWDSPAALLEKIIEYEAVHEIRSWSDLRHRLDGDRRCYAFFHPSLPKEPLVFVQVALVEGLAIAIEPLLDEQRPALDPRQADSAIFYSITNTLDGLRGISFGNFLIKQVVEDLAHDLPNLKQFATLSPIPGFMRWLAAQPETALMSADERAALRAALPEGTRLDEVLGAGMALGDGTLARLLQGPLMRSAATYLVERDERGLPLDPVARFHLGNGARIEQLNWAADTSRLRLGQSAGMMINYLYHRPEIDANHEAFASRRLITLSPQMADLLKGAPAESRQLTRVGRRGSGLGRMIRR